MHGLVALLFACQVEVAFSEGFRACGDHDCRKALVLEEYPEDAESVIAAVSSVADPIEQIALVSTIVETWPETSHPLCQALSPGPARVRCMSVVARPHLWVPAGKMRNQPRGADGQVGMPPDSTPRPLADVTALDESPCLERPDTNNCLTKYAGRAAMSGSLDRAVATCRLVEAPQWRDECVFVTAETLFQRKGPSSYSAALDLCLEAGQFQSECLDHLVVVQASAAPAADAHDPVRWQHFVRQALSFEEAWKGRAAGYGAFVVELYWSETMEKAYSVAGRVTGNPLDFAPKVAIPHVHASAAFRLVRSSGDGSDSLDTWVTRLENALEVRSEGVPEVRASGGPRPESDLWRAPTDGQGDVPSVIYRASSRRAISEDLRADLTICILEAAARRTPPLKVPLQDGLADPDRLVRWTAERLLSELAKDAG